MDPFTVSTLTAVLGRMLPEPQAGFLSGILFGTRGAMAKELVDAFVTTGTIHIVALSGQNLSIFTGTLATWLASLFSRRLSSLLIIFILVWFLWFVGPSPSLVRAVIMGSLTLLAVIFGRRNLSLRSLILAVSMMLLLNPSWIGDLSFQLSVLATLGIILFGGAAGGIEVARHSRPVSQYGVNSSGNPSSTKDWIPTYVGMTNNRSVSIFALIRFLYLSLIRVIQDDFRVTLAAQLFTTPLIFFHFHRLSLIAPVTNVLIGWTMPFIMGLGWIAAIAGYIWLPLGVLPAWATWVILTYVIRVVEITATIPWASIGK